MNSWPCTIWTLVRWTGIFRLFSQTSRIIFNAVSITHDPPCVKEISNTHTHIDIFTLRRYYNRDYEYTQKLVSNDPVDGDFDRIDKWSYKRFITTSQIVRFNNPWTTSTRWNENNGVSCMGSLEFRIGPRAPNLVHWSTRWLTGHRAQFAKWMTSNYRDVNLCTFDRFSLSQAGPRRA